MQTRPLFCSRMFDSCTSSRDKPRLFIISSGHHPTQSSLVVFLSHLHTFGCCLTIGLVIWSYARLGLDCTARENGEPLGISAADYPFSTSDGAQCAENAGPKNGLILSVISIGDRAFPIAAARTWNSLPPNVTSSRTLCSFKSKLKTYLFSLSFHAGL